MSSCNSEASSPLGMKFCSCLWSSATKVKVYETKKDGAITLLILDLFNSSLYFLNFGSNLGLMVKEFLLSKKPEVELICSDTF